jgi:hypothetical protein
MILKYKDGEVWNYIDSISKISTSEIDTAKILNKYYEDVKNGMPDYATTPNVNITYQNIIFDGATNDIVVANPEFNIDSKNLLISTDELNLLAYQILINETMLLITDQTTYLLNDNGKTIERIV